VPLSLALDRVILTRPCPNCGHQLKKQGVWFKAVGQYICEECRLFIVMTDPEKVELFEAHAHLIRKERLRQVSWVSDSDGRARHE